VDAITPAETVSERRDRILDTCKAIINRQFYIYLVRCIQEGPDSGFRNLEREMEPLFQAVIPGLCVLMDVHPEEVLREMKLYIRERITATQSQIWDQAAQAAVQREVIRFAELEIAESERTIKHDVEESPDNWN
jgi:hypothetical protein